MGNSLMKRVFFSLPVVSLWPCGFVNAGGLNSCWSRSELTER